MLTGLGRLVRTRKGHARMVVAPLPGQRQRRPIADDLVVGILRGGVRRDMLLEVRTRIAARNVHLFEIGNINNRPHADVILHQGDVDRKFVVAFDKFDRAVQRIDQPVKLPVAALFVAHLPTLFRKDRDTCGTEVLADGLVRDAVGQRDRGFVVFETYIVIVEILVNAHDRGSGSDCRIEKRRQQIHSHLVVNHRNSYFGIGNFYCHGKGNKNL